MTGETIPKIVVFHLTNMCNLSCKHCYANAGIQLPKELSLNQIKQIINELDDLGIIYLVLSGGEPLLRKEFFDVVEFSTGKSFNVMVTTNGTLLTPGICRKIKELGVRSIQISIDSSFKEKNDEFRGVHGAFLNAINGIKYSSDASLPCAVMCTLSKLNLNELSNLINLAKKNKAKSFAIERFVPTGRGKNIANLELTSSELKKSLFFLIKKKNELKGKFKINTTEPLFLFTDKKLLKTVLSLGCLAGCSAGITGSCITPDGFMTPCTRLFIKLGNVAKKGFDRVWKTSIVLKKLRNRDNLKGRCGRCKYKYICGGCRGSAYYHYKDYLQEDPLCWIGRD
jgi:radical SAM protein with 4Fe4S-binding SPASM domain